MSIRNLDKAFSPKSVALVGASVRKGSVGNTIARNLIEGGFGGDILFVNPKYAEIEGRKCHATIEELPAAPDLAVIATPPETVPDIIAELGRKGTRAAVVITAGIREKKLQQAMLDAAKPHLLRIVGPNCLGLMVPGIGLNAGFAHMAPKPGNLAFISQSGALVGAVLDWSASRGIGFSSMVSMGDMADVDVGDLLDWLAQDRTTKAVLMYLEQVTEARKFMSAARSAARVKPVIVIKSGRHEAAAKAAKSHTGALAGADNVYDAAFRRAGIVRAREMEDLFDVAEMLSHTRMINDGGLAIVTNGGGAGVLAVDRLLDCGGTLTSLSTETMEKLDTALPPTWSRANPVDIIGDADAARYESALDAVLSDAHVNTVLVMNCPTALASSTEAAAATIKAVGKSSSKVVLTSWLGEKSALEARDMFAAAGISTYDTPDDAIRAFSYLAEHRKSQAALLRTPPAQGKKKPPQKDKAARIIRDALRSGRDALTEEDAKAVLDAYHIPVVPTLTARDSGEVRHAAQELGRSGGELVVKIVSPDILHKTDSGGVALGLPGAEAAAQAADDMLARIKAQMPDARIEGFSVQPMIRRRHARELIVGISEDNTFGPVILFGAGGTAVEVIRDRAVALPPLDVPLAKDLVSRTQISRKLAAYRSEPAANMDAVTEALVSLSQIVADFPEICELDINPLLADEEGVLALDARILVREMPRGRDGLNPRFSIRPYPAYLEKTERLKSGAEISIRPIRPEDEHLYDVFLEKTTKEDLWLRLFSPLRHLDHDFIARLTQIDYARAMAFVAIEPDSGELLGVARIAADPDYRRAEFAIIVRSDRQGQGIGFTLLDNLVNYAKAEGIAEIWGHLMPENAAMLKMCHDFRFSVTRDTHDNNLLFASLALSKTALATAATEKQA